jgi:hypothetical protein
LFIEVPDSKATKTRLHFDLRPRERSRDEEVPWVVHHGAVRVADHRGVRGPGSGRVVLANPGGNESCTLRAEAEIELSEAVSSS